jgi:hypothetical protein
MKNTITGVGGDTKIVRRRVKNVDGADVLAKAWLTVKADLGDADPGVVQKTVTGTYSPGNGQIVDTGVDGTGEVYFELSTSDTVAIEGTGVYYDIQVKTVGGSIYTFEVGTVNFRADVTVSTT